MKGRTAIGTHRHRVLVQNPHGAPVADGDGAYTQAYLNAVPASWQCSIVPATARDLERVAAGTIIATASHVITGRYHPSITVATRLVFEGRVFQVTGASNPEERKIETIAICVELLGADLVGDFAWTQPGWISDPPAWVQEGTF
jgi:head-tail adaptor